MILRRTLGVALFGLAVAAVAPVTAANAAAPAYPPGNTVTLTLSSSIIPVGTTIAVSGSGFAANVRVSVTTAAANQGFAGRPATDAPVGRFAPVAAAPAVQRLAATALATVTTNGAGSFSTPLTFNQVGVFVVTATGTAADSTTGSASGTVTVLAAGGAGGGTGAGSGSGGDSASGVGGLPNTGSSIGLPLTVGAVLVLLGAGLVTVFRRRRSGDAVA